MADEPLEKEDQTTDAGDELSVGLGLGPDQIVGLKDRSVSQKVELDTAGLNLDEEEETEEAEPTEKEQEAEEEEEEEAGPGRPRWFWPVIAGGLGIILAVSGLMASRYLKKEEPKPPPIAVQAEAPAVSQPKALKGIAYVSLEDFLVPLDLPDKTALEVSINLELSSEESRPAVEKKTALVRDIIYHVLERSGQAELNSEEAQEAIRQAILREVNLKLEGGPIKNVYFSEFLIL
jgi:flagellar FliL protein